MRPNIISSQPSSRGIALLVTLLILLLLAGCNRATPAPSATPAATGVPQTDTAVPVTTEPPAQSTFTARPVTGDTPRPVQATPVPGDATIPPAQADTRAPTARPSQTPRPGNDYIFPTDESGFPLYPTDEEGNEYYPTDPAGNPIVATDEAGFPIFPIDLEGNFLIPKNPRGTPLYETDEFGFPIIEIPEEDFPTDEFIIEETPIDEEETVDVEPHTIGTEVIQPAPTSGQSIPTFTSGTLPDQPTPGTTGGFTRTPIVWATPSTNQPLGTNENPLYLGLVVTSEADFVRADAMDALARRLSEDTGLVIQARRTGSYAELLNGMRAGGVHFAWLQPFTYIVAHQRGYADVVLVSNHFGLEAYGVMFMANANSGFSTFYNANTNTSTGPAADALAQFAGGKPCWVDPMSASGYVAPAGLLAQNGVQTGEPIFLMSHAGVVRALYIQGICDFGATFGIMGDPRTSATLQQALPDVMNRVQVVWQSDSIIPMLNFSAQSRVSEDLRVQVIEALIDLVQTDQGKQMLTDANAYEIRGLKEVNDSFYQPLRDLLNRSGVNSRTLLGK